jgi:CSLREA domain-containing protein
VCLAVALITLAALGHVVPAHGGGATFTVTSAADTSDDDLGDGVCADSLSACTLRAAIEQLKSER